MKRLIIFLVFILTSCYYSEFVSYNSVNYTPTNNCEVIEDLNSIPYQYEIIGTVNTKSGALFTSYQGAIEDLKKTAMSKGADAITDIKISEQVVLGDTFKIVQAKLIRYKRDSSGNFVKR